MNRCKFRPWGFKQLFLGMCLPLPAVSEAVPVNQRSLDCMYRTVLCISCRFLASFFRRLQELPLCPLLKGLSLDWLWLSAASKQIYETLAVHFHSIPMEFSFRHEVYTYRTSASNMKYIHIWHALNTLSATVSKKHIFLEFTALVNSHLLGQATHIS